MNAIEDGKRYEEDVARREWLTEQVGKLLACEDADEVSFFSYTEKITKRYVIGFADKMMQRIAKGEIDSGSECFILQCLLAVDRGDHAQAALIYDKYLRAGINAFAEKLVLETLE